MNINDNTAPFVWITWHQKELLGCVVYSKCLTNYSYNKCIYSCCCCGLPCNYVKPFGILQRVIKSQKVYISFGHFKSWCVFSRKSVWLNFQTCFYFSGLMKRQCTVFKKKNVSSLSIWGNVLTLQTAHRNFLILFQMILLLNIYFLIRRQNKIPKIDTKMLKQ